MITIYKASAGSGKTFTLALRYISLIIGWRDNETGMWHLNSPTTPPPARHRSILAVTFTNKATAEMKTRIVETLSTLSLDNCPDDNPYLKELLRIFSSATPRDISFASRRALIQLLFDFGSFNVSTIDSFFQTVLRTFAHELNLPDNYRIQLNQQEAVDSAVHDMLDVINSNSPYFPESHDDISNGRKNRLREWILAYMESMMSEGKAFNLFNRTTSTFIGLTIRLSLLFNETYKLHSNEIDSWLDADSGTRVIKFRDALRKRLHQLRNAISERTSTLLDEVAPLGDKVINYNLMLAMKCWLEGREAPGTTPLSASKGDYKSCVYKSFYNNNALVDRIAGVCRDNLEDQHQIFCATFILKNLFPLGLFGEMRRHLEKFCREENLVLQSNTSDFLSRIISTEEEAPFIYERLGLRLQHFLLDEFQDTSAMQWNILRPLIVESLSKNNDNLIIGDGKQSIYGFRNTDFRLLNHIVAHEISQRGYEVDLHGAGPRENVNYRSSHCIVRFNNALFDAISSVYNLTPSDSDISVYADTVQEISEKTKDEPGYVDIAFFGKENEDNTSDFQQFALSRMLDGIKRQLKDGYRPKQIAVLVRRRVEGELVVKHLLNAMATPERDGLPQVQVISSDALLINESPLVKMLVARLKMLLIPLSPEQNSQAAQRDFTHLVNRFHMHLFASGGNPTLALSEAIEECSPLLSSQSASDEDDIKLLSSPASGLITMVEHIVREAVEEMKGRGQNDSDLEIHNVYLSGFMDLVNEYANRYGNDLRGFLDWWDVKKNTQSITVPDDVDAINVLTIHKAKGLEFPCVHVPFLSFSMTETSTAFKRSYSWYKTDPIPGINPELIPPYIPFENLKNLEKLTGSIANGFKDFIDRQYIDNINLLYVALTRPTRELVATAECSDKNKCSDRNSKTIGDILLHGIDEANTETPLKLNLASIKAEDSSLIIGEPTLPSDNKASVSSRFMPSLVFYDNDRVLKITKIHDRYIRDFSNPSDRNIFLKRVLSQSRHTSEIPAAIHREGHRCRLKPECSSLMLDTISHALATTPEASGWFDGYARLQLSPEIFIGKVPSIKRWRPDRIVWHTDGYIDVVEYCTDDITDERFAMLKVKVSSVMRRLADIGSTGIRGFIWNVDTTEVYRLSITGANF